MSQHYSDPAREDEPTALPDVEVFYRTATAQRIDGWENPADGWFYWYCFPGCLPDSEPCGPYATEQEAIDAAREAY